jgi:hypothetical protein
MAATTFRGDLPAAVVGLIPLIVIVAVVDAGVARRWVDRRMARTTRVRPYQRGYAYFVGFFTLFAGIFALTLALLELRFRTNRFDNLLLVLALVPVVGLSVHFASRLREELRRLPAARAHRPGDEP